MDPDIKPADRSRVSRPTGGRGNVVALVALVVLAGLLFWLVSAIQKHNVVQNCIDSGRRDCVALPAD